MTIQISADNITILSFILGVIGTISGVVGLFVSIWTARRDRANIKVEYQENMRIMIPGAREQDKNMYFVITVINKGRRPVRIGNVAIKEFTPTGERWAILTDSFRADANRLLDEKNPRTQYTLKQETVSLDNVSYIAAYDLQGREYLKSTKRFVTLWRYYKRFIRFINKGGTDVKNTEPIRASQK